MNQLSFGRFLKGGYLKKKDTTESKVQIWYQNHKALCLQDDIDKQMRNDESLSL